LIFFQAKRTVKVGIKSLMRHLMRSVLTMLGIMLGVCAVIAMLAIGTGASEEAQEQIRKLGVHNIIVRSVPPPTSQNASDTQQFTLSYGVTLEDAERIRDVYCTPGVEVTVPSRSMAATIKHLGRRIDAHVVGTVPGHRDTIHMNILKGRFLSPWDMEGRQTVCVLGEGAEKALFPLGDSLGQIVRDGAHRFEVVGVVRSFVPDTTKSERTDAADPNTSVYIPATTMAAQYPATAFTRRSGSMSSEHVEISTLIIRVDDLDNVRSVQGVVEQILKMEHTDKQDYRVDVPLELIEQARATARRWSIVLGAIAAISLVVGGIGIMNITLATVIERTREIGIRRAMGAKRRHIVVQFLVETTLLSLCGGLLGIAMGVAVPQLVEHSFGMRTIVTTWSLLLASGISVSIGIIFGIYPAWRAAHMDPIEALRHE